MGTVLEGAYLLSELPTGILADSYSRRWSVIIGMLFTAGGFALWGAIPVFESILIANVI
jgi:DHA3 family tetracycline resistance protein-like MFS transporter